MATNEEKTKVLAAQTPLAGADGVDAIAVRKGNGIELLEIGKLVPAKADGMTCPKVIYATYGDLREGLLTWATNAAPGAMMEIEGGVNWTTDNLAAGNASTAIAQTGAGYTLTLFSPPSSVTWAAWTALVVRSGVAWAYLLTYSSNTFKVATIIG